MSLWMTVAVIFIARCTDVTIGVFRILMVVKGRKIIAAALGFFEVMVFISVMNIIMGGGRTMSIYELLAYCGGFATGNIMGSFLESKLMNAYVVAEMIAEDNEKAGPLVAKLRGTGFGTTVLHGEGRSGPRLVIKVICSRKHIQRISAIASEFGCFLYVTDVKGVSGGFFIGGTGTRK